MSIYNTRNRLARAAIDKIENDKRLNRIDRKLWYKIPDLETLPEHSKFILLNEDRETKEFITNCFNKSEEFFTQLFHSIVITMLKMFMATTSINGLLQRGSMFVFSEQHFSALIEYETRYQGVKLDNLLDLGAGDGAVTAKMAPFFINVYATEMSQPMQWRLKQKGYKIFDVNNWDTQLIESESNQSPNNVLKYDAIACLNLLDRCDEPITLLKQMKNALKSDGLLIIALVLPYKPFVEYNKDNRPYEDLMSIKDSSLTCRNQSMYNGKMLNKINFQIHFLVEEVFEPLGFELLKLTRLPYLCEGNMEQSFYFLHDYVFILKSKD